MISAKPAPPGVGLNAVMMCITWPRPNMSTWSEKSNPLEVTKATIMKLIARNLVIQAPLVEINAVAW